MPRNPFICLTIVAVLGASVLLGLLGVIILTLHGMEAPPTLIAIVSAALGSMSSFLVSVPRGSVGGDNPPAKVPSPLP